MKRRARGGKLAARLRLLTVLGLLGLGGLAFWQTRPARPAPELLARLEAAPADAERGRRIFDAAGCAGCHSAPDAKGAQRLVLSGGRHFPSPFGTFVAPNISPDPQAGIGRWSRADLAAALLEGTSPDGRHYYPAFPYTTYTHMRVQDIADLFAYLRSLPPSSRPSQPHSLGFPFNIRATLGIWKALFLRRGWVLAELPDAQAEAGRYLVEALAHCGECHTPRGALGQSDTSRWLAGAPDPTDPTGRAHVPNITPARLAWSEADLIGYFQTGFTPEYDVAGGAMAEVIDNLKRLPRSDLEAIVAYLRRVPPIAPLPRAKGQGG